MEKISFHHGENFIPPWRKFHSTMEKISFHHGENFIPPWRKFHSTMEKISFHHGEKIVPPWWNDFSPVMERFKRYKSNTYRFLMGT